MKIKIGMVLSAVSLMASAQSNAADFPKQGEAEYDTYYVFENWQKLRLVSASAASMTSQA